MSSLPARRLIFTGKQQVILEAYDLPAPAMGQVRLRTEFSLMSTGTENIVFNRLFDPGTHWDNWVKYPFQPGYSSVGVVESVGEGVETLRVGERVVIRGRHTSASVLAAADCVRVPDGLAAEKAVWYALAKIAFMGVLAAKYTLGDSVLIIGAGPIGQMSLRWASAAGAAHVIVVDSAGDRLPAAKAGGATATIISGIDDARDAVLAAGEGTLPRVVVDSTGNARVFAAALSLAAKGGTVVVLGDTGAPTQQSLTSDVITRGLRIVGAHDGLNTPEWNNVTVGQLFVRLAADGRFPLDGLTSHRFRPEDCAEAYATANRDRARTMGILFDWGAAA